MLSVGVLPVGVSLAEAQGLSDVPRDMLPAPQLVMLANVAAVAESGGRDSSVADEKEMVELKTVGCSYSDSEDENVIRSVDHFVLHAHYLSLAHLDVCAGTATTTRTARRSASWSIQSLRTQRASSLPVETTETMEKSAQLKANHPPLSPVPPPATTHLSRAPNVKMGPSLPQTASRGRSRSVANRVTSRRRTSRSSWIT